MTKERRPLTDCLAKGGDGGFLYSVAETALRLVMETLVEGLIGSGCHDRSIEPRLGSPDLRLPKLRQGTYFPPFLESRRTSERVLVAAIPEVWVGGLSTRRVGNLARTVGLADIGKSSVPSCATRLTSG